MILLNKDKEIVGYIAFWLSVFALSLYYNLQKILSVKLFD